MRSRGKEGEREGGRERHGARESATSRPTRGPTPTVQAGPLLRAPALSSRPHRPLPRTARFRRRRPRPPARHRLRRRQQDDDRQTIPRLYLEVARHDLSHASQPERASSLLLRPRFAHLRLATALMRTGRPSRAVGCGRCAPDLHEVSSGIGSRGYMQRASGAQSAWGRAGSDRGCPASDGQYVIVRGSLACISGLRPIRKSRGMAEPLGD